MKVEELSEVGLRIWEEYIDMLKTAQKDSWFTEDDWEDVEPLPEVEWDEYKKYLDKLKEENDEQEKLQG